MNFFHRLYEKVYCNPVAYAMLGSLLENHDVQNLNEKEFVHILATVVDLTAENNLQSITSRETIPATKAR